MRKKKPNNADESFMGYMILTASQAKAAGLYEGQTDYSNLDFNKITDGQRSQLSEKLPNGYVLSSKLNLDNKKEPSLILLDKRTMPGRRGYIYSI